jgi:acyl carrier protein
MEALKKQILDTMCLIFNASEAEIKDDTFVFGQTEKWDSLKHLSLILALEQELECSISPEDATQMLTYELIVETLKEKG